MAKPTDSFTKSITYHIVIVVTTNGNEKKIIAVPFMGRDMG